MSNEWMPPSDDQNGAAQGGGQPYGPPQGGQQPPPPPPAPMQPMGAMPPDGGAGMPSKPSAPQSVQLAVKGMYVGAALSLLSLIVALFSRGAIRDAVEKSNATNAGTSKHLSADQVDTAVGVAFGVAIVVGLIGIGLWILMARTNQAGHGWARIVATVLAVLCVLSTLSSFARSGNTVWSSIVSIIMVLLAIGITVMLYRPDSNEFFNRCKAARLGR